MRIRWSRTHVDGAREKDTGDGDYETKRHRIKGVGEGHDQRFVHDQPVQLSQRRLRSVHGVAGDRAVIYALHIPQHVQKRNALRIEIETTRRISALGQRPAHAHPFPIRL